jgi:hypothetical protein
MPANENPGMQNARRRLVAGPLTFNQLRLRSNFILDRNVLAQGWHAPGRRKEQISPRHPAHIHLVAVHTQVHRDVADKCRAARPKVQ